MTEAPRFGTSGLRGLVSALTESLVRDHVTAFLATCDCAGTLFVGRDLRASSPAIAGWVIDAARAAGVATVDCGVLPTPALALAALGHGAVMVTGSHIPADRNGLKFYTRTGEITKADETAISAAISAASPAPAPVLAASPAPLRRDDAAATRYLDRYRTAFAADTLAGRRIGVWQHSSVARDLLTGLLGALGAEPVPLDRAEHFVPVDTEAVDAATRDRLAGWVRDHRLDALVSTDGDADRPLLVDGAGRVVPGDLMGQVAAAWLGTRVVVTPVSSNTGVEAGGRFDRVIRTRIGSPHVIAGMEAALAADPAARVAGYEANGGFLLGFAAETPVGRLAPLPTRDAVLPVLATLAAAGRAPLADRIAAEPARFTAADRLQEVPTARSAALLAALDADPAARAALLGGLGAAAETALDRTDGLRITLADGAVLHLRPSGNAPEFRVYIEDSTPEDAARRLAATLDLVARRLAG